MRYLSVADDDTAVDEDGRAMGSGAGGEFGGKFAGTVQEIGGGEYGFFFYTAVGFAVEFGFVDCCAVRGDDDGGQGLCEGHGVRPLPELLPILVGDDDVVELAGLLLERVRDTAGVGDLEFELQASVGFLDSQFLGDILIGQGGIGNLRS